MVSDSIETHQPAYPLDQLREAAQAGNLLYMGRNVSRDINNLGYTENEVICCIAGLCPKHYQKTLAFTDSGAAFDVYIRDFEHQGRMDRIYMKLRLLPGGLVQVAVGSFHLSR